MALPAAAGRQEPRRRAFVRLSMEDFDMAEENRTENQDKTGSAGGGTAGGGDHNVVAGAGASLGAAGAGTGPRDDTGGLTESAAGQSARRGDDKGLGGVDAGSPGGMGGVGVAGGTGSDRPPGGVSPVQDADRN